MVGGSKRVGQGPTRPPSAAAHGAEAWNQIDWAQVNRNVSRLQARIVKATAQCRWGKVRALQRLLTHSFSGRALAVKRVTSKRGKRTPGVDGETWTTPARKEQAIHELRQHGYQPKPLRRVYIEKRNTTKKRPLGIPSMKDRAMQALYLLALAPIAETTGDEASYGFRPGRSTADAIGRCFQLLSRKRAPQWVLEGDIRSCFDQISHGWLEGNIPMDGPILHRWLKVGYIDKSVFYRTEAGTPQGGVASPVLANMALDGLQATLRGRFGSHSGVHMARYADDFIITARTERVLRNEVVPLVDGFMRERGLELSMEKTVATRVDAGFEFLGFNLRKYENKLLIKPSKQRTLSFVRKVRGLIEANKAVTAGRLVVMLNPVIRGWANYYRHAVSSAVFSYVDSQIWKALWRWAVRRHPNKGKKWVKRRYFATVDGQDWTFTGNADYAKGERRTVYLVRASSIKITRHVPIRGQANPFDPAWAAYFDDRRKARRRAALERQKRLSSTIGTSANELGAEALSP